MKEPKWIERVESINLKVGQWFSWLTLAMVLVTFAIVIFRYIFHSSWIWLQETVVYMHAIVFLCLAGFNLVREEHVRVDIFYRDMSHKKKSLVDFLGVLFFLWPTCAVLFFTALPFVEDSWSVKEVSVDSNGLPLVFLLKSFILVFAGLLALQGLVIALRSIYSIFYEKPAGVEHGGQ